jgi:hypothetical protein
MAGRTDLHVSRIKIALTGNISKAVDKVLAFRASLTPQFQVA